MGKRGVSVDQAPLQRWGLTSAPAGEKQCRRRQQPVGRSWGREETSGKSKGQWAYLYRAVDKASHTIDFLLSPTRERAAAEAFLHKVIRNYGLPEKMTIE